MDWNSVRWLSFDCYGTLIDWESGILAAVRPVLAAHGATPADAEILERFAALESAIEAGPYLPYREVLRRVMQGLGREFGVALDARACESLPEALKDWPAFPDTPAALAALQRRFRLAVLSNVDDDLFAATLPRLGVTFDAVVTAQQCGSYKPARRNFERLLERTGASRDDLVHVAQSLYHDHVPARAMGLRTVWVNRRRGLPGAGATPPAAATPDLEVATLAELAAAIA